LCLSSRLAAIRIDRREGAYLLLADIEEAETGDQGKVRQLLSKAVRAPRDPAWVADGVVSERWAPVSPVTGKLDAFTWRAPMERLGQLIDSHEDAAMPAIAVSAPSVPVEERPIDLAPDEKQPVATSADGEKDVTAAPEDETEAVEQASELPRLPDDPGVTPEDEAEKSPRRFRLF
ncbi:MAG: heme biosynthesis protein HemY, partial [Mesorhizobium sp.]